MIFSNIKLKCESEEMNGVFIDLKNSKNADKIGIKSDVKDIKLKQKSSFSITQKNVKTEIIKQLIPKIDVLIGMVS